jgi:hypothetical protein
MREVYIQAARCHLDADLGPPDLTLIAWASAVGAMLSPDEIRHALAKPPRRMSADALARMLRLTVAERTAWDIRTIGALGRPKPMRRAERKVRHRQRAEESRREAGIMTRAQYLAECANRPKPWAEAGISRTTWWRRRKQ